MKSKKQLYTFIPDVEFPSVLRFDGNTGEVLTNKDISKGVYLFHWPDGTTCFPIEMYLAYLVSEREVTITKEDGGTVGTYASSLSHLARYCYQHNVEFWELTTSHIDELISELVAEKKFDGLTRARNNDTITRIILPKCVAFLKWFQTEHCPAQYLIGVDAPKKRYQIKLKVVQKRGRNGRNFGPSEVFPTSLPTSANKPKAPIAASVIKRLWDTLNDTREEMQLNSRLSQLFDKEDQKEHLNYMYHRRRIQLELLEATGLRPKELVRIPYSSNVEHIESARLEIPTYKREEARFRIIPIERSVAMRLDLFMSVHRENLINRLLKYDLISNESEVDDIIYLAPDTGKSVKQSAAYMDFKRLSQRANIEVKNCQSMFRHRFATNMVKLHLISFMDKNPLKNLHNFNDKDYETILKKVATFTDHKDPKSLNEYIDLAWEELDVFEYAYEVKNLHSRFNAITKLVSDMRKQIKQLKLNEGVLESTLCTLEAIEREANLLVDKN
ncbi:TPA: tyrosine-type recombinase/integrase [Vibrio parahaemolyticus]|uniref:tyrosine-type recombinase/integrase n=1 Tax=Vibrio TaxID=662 RepID=UPI001428559E|nr:MULTISPECIES: tyrosine-type recombinase/integrase [Vibrio]EJG0888031.1 site-specific integrase [Vibrio parahaemolyticus]MCR9515355.1 tyrosine-type recombinase/integrase [Vibrio alginolyticus]MDY8151212.1 tyrosine-type recombinase/integrase [Vibrio sp. PBL-C16]QIR94248.1 site-specific integrase [Vibrio alginolyticus]HAS6445850.1 tyrosine-type recombinase/integrase [Vibrio parahaemolyticus]